MTELNERITAYRASASELKRLLTLREAKCNERNEAQVTAAKLKAALGERLLVAAEAEDAQAESMAVSETSMASVRADGLTAVIAALDVRITSATTAMHQAHAGAIRADAARLRIEAAEAQRPVDDLLARLLQLTGCEYQPKRTPRPPLPMVQVGNRAVSLPTGGAPQIVTITRTHVEELLSQAEHYDKAADCIEQGAPIATSHVDGKPLAKLTDFLQVAPVQASPMEMN